MVTMLPVKYESVKKYTLVNMMKKSKVKKKKNTMKKRKVKTAKVIGIKIEILIPKIKSVSSHLWLKLATKMKTIVTIWKSNKLKSHRRNRIKFLI